MNKNICFLITTFNRSESCKRLTEAIRDYGEIFILDDGSSENYEWAHQYHYKRNNTNGCKHLYWQTVSSLWQMIQPHAHKFQYFIMVSDDFLPELNMIRKAIATWKAIRDPNKICLNLYTDRSRLNSPCWTNQLPVILPEARKIQWVDMCFFSEIEFFEQLKWHIPPIELDWQNNPTLSSGVGSYISRKFDSTGFTMYQTHASLFIPQSSATESRMNSWRKASDPINQYVPGLITAQIASIPSRVKTLERTVASLRPQVDKIFVALNGYGTITPDFLNPGEYKHFDNSHGDAVKFFGIENYNGYLFTADDDLIYPPGYVTYMISKLHQYHAVITLHGKIYPRPFIGFLKIEKNVRCLGCQETDIQVDVPGTGVLCLHTDLIKLRLADFSTPNMADCYFAAVAKRQNVRIMAVAHPEDYLKYEPQTSTIWETEKQNLFIRQTVFLEKLYNS